MADDFQLLRKYWSEGSEDAFRTLVERHAGMVHGAALRMLRDAALAEDVTQAVFVLLARKAPGLGERTLIAGWLYRTTRFVALQAIRTEQRRCQQHLNALSMNDSETTAWEKIAPCLEEAMSRLDSLDRDALVLRFFEDKTFAQVGDALGTSEAAAKMRIGRALEKLRKRLGKKGVILPSAALLAALAAHGVTEAPASVLSSVSAAAVSAGQAGAAGVSTTLVKETIIMTTRNQIRTVMIAVVIALLLTSTMWVAIQYTGWGGKPSSAKTAKINFEPMAGEWQGSMSLRIGGNSPPVEQLCGLSVKTLQDGRTCEIEMRLKASLDGPTEIHHYTHTINERGDEIFTLSDPRTGRGDGNGQVTEYLHEAGMWHLAVHFPFPGSRGVMDCRWERKGDQLSISSHDEYFRPQGSDHVYANLQLTRATAAVR